MNFIDLIYAVFVGWCGARWTIIGIFKPQPDPWKLSGSGLFGPVMRSLTGAVAGPIVVYTMGGHFAGAGILGITALSFFGGSFAADVATAAVNVLKRQAAKPADIKSQRS